MPAVGEAIGEDYYNVRVGKRAFRAPKWDPFGIEMGSTVDNLRQ